MTLPIPPEIVPFNKPGLQVRLKQDRRFPNTVKAGYVMPVDHIDEPFDLQMCHKHDGSDPRDWGIRCAVMSSVIPKEEKTSGFWDGWDGPVCICFYYHELEIVEGAPLIDMKAFWAPYKQENPGPFRVWEEVGPAIFNTAGVAEAVIDKPPNT
jgi:hypothetical protein